MLKEYKEELKMLEDRMVKAEIFAKKIPMFSEKIIKEKLTGEEHWYTYIDYYKKVRTFHGAQRGYFKSGTPRTITNYNSEHDGYYWNIYINTLCEYDSHANYGLETICKEIPLFFYDRLNATFYCTDDQIEVLLETLNEWKIKALEQLELDSIDERIRLAKETLKESKEKLKRLEGK